MTTQSWSTRVRHDSDANFREWGSEFASKLAAVGLVQTSDTGQINWTTVTRAGTNADAGYEIWRFDDGTGSPPNLQATAPIYIRFDYGTHTGATDQPSIKMRVGTGSNGSGTLTGTALSQNNVRFVTNASSTVDTARTSYMCHVDGCFWVAWKLAASGVPNGFAYITRSCDNTGDPTVTAALVVWGTGAGGLQSQALRFASSAATYTFQNTAAAAQLGFLPQAIASSSINSDGDMQVAVGWMWTPTVTPVFSAVGALVTDIADANTLSTTPVGSTARTFIAMPIGIIHFSATGTSATTGLRFCPIWE